MFVSVVSLLYRNGEFGCFDWTETKQKHRNKQKNFKNFDTFANKISKQWKKYQGRVKTTCYSMSCDP
jgi:hypothetical protein